MERETQKWRFYSTKIMATSSATSSAQDGSGDNYTNIGAAPIPGVNWVALAVVGVVGLLLAIILWRRK